MDHLYPTLLDHLALFNTSLGVVAIRQLHEHAILSDEDLVPIHASLALLAEATEQARGTAIGTTFADMLEELIRVLPGASCALRGHGPDSPSACRPEGA